jgi:rod shape determining protein RodA
MRPFFKLFERFDWTLLTAALTLTTIGLIAVYGIGISQEEAGLFTFNKQFIAMILGVSSVLGLVWLDYRHLRSFGLLTYLAGAFLLLAVLLFGHTINGTQGWFRIGGLSFQPVEVAKLTLTIYLAALYVRYEHGQSSWRTFLMSAFATGGYLVLVMLQPDFGSAMVMLGTWLLMSLFAGWPRRAWIILPLLALLFGGLAWSFVLKPYQKDRVANFLNPNTDLRGSGYNAAQARIAIGSGGLFGKGIGEGSQARLRFLPEASTDFMFAVIGEELGFAGVTLVLCLFLLIIFRFLRLAYEAEDDFAALMLVGLASIFLIHVLENAGMNLGVMPITGIPMPFVSAAASSLVVAFVSLGFAESVAVRRKSVSFE